MTKKGQGLPLNTIIIAIIVLVVLVVIIAIFTGRIALFSSDLDKAASLEGTKVRAQLIGQNCVPSDAGIRNEYTNAAGENKKVDQNEETNLQGQIQSLIADCKGLQSEGACRGNCQWQGS